MDEVNRLLELIAEVQTGICGHLRAAFESHDSDQLSAVAREGDDDTIFEIDRVTEDYLVEKFERVIAPEFDVVLKAEGLPAEGRRFGTGRGDPRYTILMDPLDGTRGLMYGKRSAWVLSGIAAGCGDGLTLRDIGAAVMTEVPPPKQSVADQLSAVAGRGASGLRIDLSDGSRRTFVPRPTGADSLKYGFATFVRFFPGTKRWITEIEDRFVEALKNGGAETFYFEDQYISSGGQLAELIMGRDRFVCDLRGIVAPLVVAAGGDAPLCAHPYDVCTELIARECGVIVTDQCGGRLEAPLDTMTDVPWIGYGNQKLRQLLEEPLMAAVRAVAG